MKEWLFDIFKNYWYFIVPYFLVIGMTHIMKINMKMFKGEKKDSRTMALALVLSLFWNICPSIFIPFPSIFIRLFMHLVYSFLCGFISIGVIAFINKAKKEGLITAIFDFFKSKLKKD